MKKKGILLNTLISTAKILPLGIAFALTVAMIIYIVLVNVIPYGYLSRSSFLPETVDGGNFEMIHTRAFCEHVALGYSEKGGDITADAIESILKVSVNEDGSITLEARTSNALASYYIVQTAVESAEYLYQAQGGDITVISAPSVPTTLSRVDITPYVLIFAITVFVAILVVGIFKGLTLGKINSEKEFRRTSSLPVIGVLGEVTEEKSEEVKA